MTQDYDVKTDRFHVAGTNYYQENILSLSKDNASYDSTEKELIEDGMTDEKIYEFYFNPQKCILIPEPDNKYDKNAIRVEADGVPIGYIKKGSTSRVKKLISSENFLNASIDIGGGKYKIVEEETDDDGNQIYDLIKGESNYWAIVEIYTKMPKKSVSINNSTQEQQAQPEFNHRSENRAQRNESVPHYAQKAELTCEQKYKNRKLFRISIVISAFGVVLSLILHSGGFLSVFAIILILSLIGYRKNK